jgi:putative pyoverdin transport system ATP-binding/permease protein
LNLLEFIKKESDINIRNSIIMATLSGVANGAILVVIVSSAEATDTENGDTQFFLIFIIALLLFIITKKKIFTSVARMTEAAIKRVRLRIADKVRHSDMQTVETIGESSIFNSITQDCTQISTSAPVIMNALQSAVMLLFSLFYILYLSSLGFIITVAAIVIAALVYEISRRKVMATLRETSKTDKQFFEVIDHIVNGFKENKVNSRRSSAVMRYMKQVADNVMTLKVKASSRESINFLFSQTFFYTLLGVIIFLLPVVTEPEDGEILRITTSVLFIMGPVSAVLVVVPLLSRVNIAIQNIYRLEDSLSAKIPPEIVEKIQAETTHYEQFQPMAFKEQILLKNVLFEHISGGDVSFTLGPLPEVTINKGEILFIEGGNGSGKSTFLKILTGLYYPHNTSSISVDGAAVTRYNYASYRELYSIVFTDFHLANQLFGLETIAPEKVREMLEMLKIDHKTEFRDGALSTVNLSTGQRKRLAVAVTLLEDKEIMIFDEVAADQDPEFKKSYYTQLLPKLKAQGKTVVVVTHDDMYFTHCDRKLKMANGVAVQETHYDGNGTITFDKDLS